VPVDLGETVDFAQVLLARAAAVAHRAPGVLRRRPRPPGQPLSDARSLRRLFLGCRA
jgi:hypothetical protein